MNSILIEAQFFPSVEYLTRCIQADSVVIEAHDHFQKGEYRNRCHIAGANGIQVLSVPLRREKDGETLRSADVRSVQNIKISYDVDWQKQHWRTLQTAYGSAPFWAFYAPILARFFTHKFDYLLDYNVEILKTIFTLLKIDKSVIVSKSTCYEVFYTDGSDFRQLISPKMKSDFEATPYSQLFNDRYDFISNLSVLDVLFCCGNQSLSVLKNK